MTEQELEAEIKYLIDVYKKLNKSSGAEKHSYEIACEGTATKIIVQLILDFHRIAEALNK